MFDEILLHKSVLLELNALVTVHGSLQIDQAGTISFEPALDARILGQRAVRLALSAVQSVRRIDGGRRVVIEAHEPLIFRGSAAQQAYVILSAFLDIRNSQHPVDPVFVKAVIHHRLWKASGILSMGISGIGFGVGDDSFWSGANDTTWMQFRHMTSLVLDFPGLHLHAGNDALVLECSEPIAVRDRIVKRWFKVSDPNAEGSSWSCLAVKHEQLNVILGRLVVGPKGLGFEKIGSEEPEILIPRRRAGVMVIEEPLLHGNQRRPELLLLGTDEQHLVSLQVRETQDTLEALEVLLSAPEWFPPATDQQSLAMEAVLGPSSYASVWRGHDLLATRSQVVVAPFSGKLRLKLDRTMDPPTLPCGVQVEVANARGRNLITGLLTEWQGAEGKRGRSASASERSLLILLENELQSGNRRQFYRLPLKDTIPLLQLQPPPQEGRFTLPPAIEIEGAMLLELSRSGATLWLPRSVSDDMTIHFQLVVETREHPKPTVPDEEGEEEQVPEITAESFHLMGRPVHSREMRIGKVIGWRVGVAFVEDAGHSAFDARQRAFLRHRAEERDERSYGAK